MKIIFPLLYINFIFEFNYSLLFHCTQLNLEQLKIVKPNLLRKSIALAFIIFLIYFLFALSNYTF